MMAERRKRLDATRREQMVALLLELPIALDPETTARAWSAPQGLAERFRLTVYDAVYLELAVRKQLPLASLDEALRKAGTAMGLEVLGGAPA